MTAETLRPDVEVRSVQTVLPGDTNPYGSLFGGMLLQWMDKMAAVTAMRFCRQPVVTASLESLDFRRPGRSMSGPWSRWSPASSTPAARR